MLMKDVFDKLKKLQDILVKKYSLESKLKDEPKQINTSKELLERMKKEYIDKNQEYDNVKSTVLKLRTDLDDAVKSRESGEKSMDNITTHREYEALDKQISEATAKEQDLRKELQKQEKMLSEVKENLDSYEAMISSQEKDINDHQSDIDKNLESYNRELEKLKKEEDKIKPGLDSEIVFKFERIIERNSKGIVAVRSGAGGKYGVCTGCHMILPAQFVNEVREGENIYFCPYCSRILYYEESTDKDETFYNFDAGGSLIDEDDDGYDENDENNDDRDEDEVSENEEENEDEAELNEENDSEEGSPVDEDSES